MSKCFYKLNRDAEFCYITKWVGDYHAPRLIALDEELSRNQQKLVVVQLENKSTFYSHRQHRRNILIKSLNFLFLKSNNKLHLFYNTILVLFKLKPKGVLVLGYNDIISIASLIYAKFFFKKIYFFSDSKYDDQKRSKITEIVKSIILKFFNGALVAGNRHRNYFKSLGFNKPIEIPYDVIDNNYFSTRAEQYLVHGKRIIEKNFGSRYVICVSRLVNRKNIPLALEIFANSNIATLGWNFVLIGDGPETEIVKLAVENLKLTQNFIHIKEIPNHRMPAIYSNATALILASEYDQWGLCVNEAMACGVPTCVTLRCGAANEIVTNDTGFVFEPHEKSKASEWLYKISTDNEYRNKLSINCKNHMKFWNTDSFAKAIIRLNRGI